MAIKTHLQSWLRLVYLGDWLILSLALLATVISFALLWAGGKAEKAVIKRDGQVLAELPLDKPRQLHIDGALAAQGATVIEIAPGRARVLADPGPQQYCVRQGWLQSAGAIAICAPSHISLQLSGGKTAYDSIGY